LVAAAVLNTVEGNLCRFDPCRLRMRR